MIDHDSWLGFGVKRGCTVLTDVTQCSIGGYINDTNYTDIDISDNNYFELSSVNNWLNIGIQNGWMSDIGCVKHELNKFNFVLDLQNMIPMNSESLPPRSHIPENKQYFAYQKSQDEDAITLFKEAQKALPCDSIIDIGCGLGELLEVASGFGYRDLLGIDVQPDLIESAIPGLQATLETVSAEDYLLPDKQMHIYMFNPFNNEIMAKFLDNNIDNIKRNNSCILYNYNFLGHHLMLHYGMKNIFNNSYSGLYKFD